MKKITKDELEVFLTKHKLWLLDKDGGERADLSGADLSEANLSGANLFKANLSGTYLSGADLSEATLWSADLSGADLSGADLSRATLFKANLSGADLSESNLSGANLLRADLSEADLSEADLSGADLWGADLSRANLSGTDLFGAENVYYTIACPDKGEFIGFKKASGYIVELRIPSDAKRCCASSRKCRCSKAEVLSITKIDGADCDLQEIASSYDKTFIYRVGEIVEVNDFDNNRWKECSTGIHFFTTRQEAVNYVD